MAAVFGIHVGNTSACLAVWKDEYRVEVVANDAGDRVTPTLVQWSPETCTIGRAAVLEHFKNESNTIVRNKQILNDNISVLELEYLKSKIAYKIIKSDKYAKYELLFEGKQHHVSPRDILVYIYQKIHAIAKAAVSGDKKLNAVLCVPLYFSLKSVELIKDIAVKVGFNVLQVIDEPCSAALGAGLGYVIEESSYHCLIYRVGGVTLDATVLLVQDGMFSVLSSIHKYDLGGALFTEKLAEFLANEFKRQYRSAELTARGKHKLYDAAERVKQILSIQNLAQCSAESVGSGYDLNCSVSRARFENMIAPYLSDFISPVKEVVTQNGLTLDKIKKVVLCGGSLKVPKLQEALHSILSSAEFTINSSPDELISIGAAMQAGFCMKYELSPNELTVDTPCLSAAINIKVKTGGSEGTTSYTIPELSSLPLKKHYEVSGVDKFVTVDVDIFEKTIVNLGNIELNELEPLSFVSIDVDINKEGKLLVTLTNEATSIKNYMKFNLNEICPV